MSPSVVLRRGLLCALVCAALFASSSAAVASSEAVACDQPKYYVVNYDNATTWKIAIEDFSQAYVAYAAIVRSPLFFHGLWSRVTQAKAMAIRNYMRGIDEVIYEYPGVMTEKFWQYKRFKKAVMCTITAYLKDLPFEIVNVSSTGDSSYISILEM